LELLFGEDAQVAKGEAFEPGMLEGEVIIITLRLAREKPFPLIARDAVDRGMNNGGNDHGWGGRVLWDAAAATRVNG
jgi:hypothetical protein